MRRWLRFEILVWVAAVGVALWRVGGPLLQNAIARRTWVEHPCQRGVARHDDWYVYTVNGEPQMASRRNFWQVNEHHGGINKTDPVAFNDNCWVDPSDTREAVLRLDTLTNWSGAWEPVRASVMALVAATILNVVIARKRGRGAAAGISAPNGKMSGGGA